MGFKLSFPSSVPNVICYCRAIHSSLHLLLLGGGGGEEEINKLSLRPTYCTPSPDLRLPISLIRGICTAYICSIIIDIRRP